MKRLLLLLLPGCLAVPSEEAPMCAATSDCDHGNGEICDDGICWGNPPAGTFAAIVSPPSSRTNLAARELNDIVINQDGWIDQLQLEKPLTYSAMLACQAPIMCDPSMLKTTITVTRPSTFPGGPGFRSVVKTEPGKPFTIAVPPPHESYDVAATYTITVVPDGRDEMGTTTTPAQFLPPLRTQLTIEGNAAGKLIELGGIELPTISGVIKNDANVPQANYRVVAVGRWDYASTPTEVSTVDFTGSDGSFQIQLSGGLVQEIEIVAVPRVNLTRPTLHYKANIAQTGLQGLQLAWPPSVGNAVQLDVPVKAVEGNGEVKPARGARVIISSTSVTANGQATYVAEATTDDFGRAKLSVLDGAAFTDPGYRISIVPQANSTAGIMYDQPFPIVQPIPEKQLKTRVALRGIVQLDGKGVKDMSVTARPSLRFAWSLDEGPQAFLQAIPPSVSVTPDSGEFVVWVDPNLVDIWGHYDLIMEAASGSPAPNQVISAIEVPRIANQTTVQLGIYDLPPPAYVRSLIVDDRNNLLEGAELKLYKTENFDSLCREVMHPPMNCMTLATAATLISRGASDADGEVRLTLPR